MSKLFLVLLLAISVSAATRHKSVIAGSRDSMIRQNEEIDRLHLPRIVNTKQLRELIAQTELVRIPENETLSITANLQEDHKFCRPWTRDFVTDMGVSFFNNFKKPLVIDSAVRTVEQQHALRRINRFAAPEYGSYPSSHLAGITVDIAKRRYTPRERKWIVNYLSMMKAQGLVEASEEPYCFHVAVYEKYNERRLYEYNTSDSLISPYSSWGSRLHEALYRPLL